MIKKIIACLTICFIITGIISPVFSDASALPQPNWSDPGISEIINISDLTGWMLNGGTFDVSTYTDAESFMNDYYNSRTRTRLISPSEDPLDDYYEVLPGFGINNQFVPGDSFARPLDTNRVISSSFRDHTGYGRRLSNEVNDALLSSGSLYDTKIPLLNEIEFANFVGYNHNALRLYTEFFNNSDDSNIDPDFSFIKNINKFLLLYNNTSYNFFDYSTATNYPWNNVVTFSPNNFSYYAWGSENESNFIQAHNNGASSIKIVSYTPLMTINVDTSNPNGVTVSYSSASNGQLFYGQGNGYYNIWVDNGNLVQQNFGNQAVNLTTVFTGLSSALNYLFSHFCNINLYVDNEPWVLVDDPISSNPITPEFPDAVGGEDLPATTWPVFRPRAPYYTNVPGVLQAIEDAIADDGKLDIDDLKPYLTDANGDPVPDPIFDPEPIPIPVPDPVNPDVVPGLPVLPAMPPEMPGFSGVSVLAEIINFTNQSLPTSLIVTFWGIVFGIVILGLIKILHK